MIIEKSDLIKTLEAVKPGLAKKAIIEQFTHFVFTGEEVVTYNDELCISHPLKTVFSCSAPANKLYKTLTSIPGNASVTMELKDDRLTIKTASTEASFNTMVEKDAEDRIKMLNLSSIEQWYKLPKDFLKAVFFCMFSASRDMTKGVATCIYWKDNKIISGDSHRMSIYYFGEPTGQTVFIPAKSAIEMVNFDTIIECNIGESWAHFRTEDGVVFSTRIMDGEYPDVEQYFVEEGTRLILPPELKSAIDSTMFMTEGLTDTDKRMRMKIEPGKISCKMSDSLEDWITKTVESDYKKEPIEIEINPLFLSQVMEKSTIVYIGERCLFSRENFKHLLTLPRI